MVVEPPKAQPLELNIVRGRVISFACPVCQTVMRASEEELGHAIMCPSCYSPVTVGGEKYKRPIPAPEPEPPGLVLEDSGDDEYRLAEGGFAAPEPSNASAFNDNGDEDEYRVSDALERPVLPSPNRPLAQNNGDEESLELEFEGEAHDRKKPQTRQRAVAPADQELASEVWQPPGAIHRPSLEERLAAAQSGDGEMELPDHPFTVGVAGFIFRRSVWKRWLGISLGTAVVYFFLANAVASGIGGGKELFYSLIFGVMGAASALLLVLFESVAVLAIVQDTSAGSDEIESWPDFNFVDWVGQAFYVLNAIAFSAAPGFILASSFPGWGPNRWWAPAITGALLFPVILLSQLDGWSPFSLLTPGVAKGAVKSPLSWLAFYGVSLIVLGIGAILGWATVRFVKDWHGPVAAAVWGVLATTMLMLESRLIGRLGWFCVQEAPPVETSDEEAEQNVQITD